MIKYLFLDLDDTILDFKKAEAIAIRKTMAAYGADPTDANAARYSQVNDIHWKALERGEMTREQVLKGRFTMFFGELGKEGAAAVIAECGFEPTVRGETLDIPDFAKLANAIARRRSA